MTANPTAALKLVPMYVTAPCRQGQKGNQPSDTSTGVRLRLPSGVKSLGIPDQCHRIVSRLTRLAKTLTPFQQGQIPFGQFILVIELRFRLGISRFDDLHRLWPQAPLG